MAKVSRKNFRKKSIKNKSRKLKGSIKRRGNKKRNTIRGGGGNTRVLNEFGEYEEGKIGSTKGRLFIHDSGGKKSYEIPISELNNENVSEINGKKVLTLPDNDDTKISISENTYVADENKNKTKDDGKVDITWIPLDCYAAENKILNGIIDENKFCSR